MIKFACSKCGRKISVEDKCAGKKGKCPGCGQAVVVPGQTSTIKFTCGHCGQSIKVPESYAGKKGKCPKCKEPVEVPSKEESTVSPPTPTPEPTPSSTVSCAMCGHEIVVLDGSPNEAVQCPECGCLVDPVSGEIASGPEEVESGEDVEEPYDEEDTSAPPRPPVFGGGPDRRLIAILAGAGLVLIVAVVGLVVFLKSSGAKSPERPRRDRAPREAAQEVDPSSRRANPVVEQPAAVPVASANLLRFAPVPDEKRTLRISTEVAQSIGQGQPGGELKGLEIFDFDFEAGSLGSDGSISLTVSLARVQIKLTNDGQTMEGYDSANPQDRSISIADDYTPVFNKPFTIRVASNGEIVDCDFDALFGQSSFGAPLMNRDKISDLLGEIFMALPEEAIRTDATWSRPICIPQVDRQFEMMTEHKMTALDDRTCTIQARGQRSQDEGPIVKKQGPLTISQALGGSTDVTYVMDRQIGWLLNKDQKTKLSGQIVTAGSGNPDFDGTQSAVVEITTTVTTMQ